MTTVPVPSRARARFCRLLARVGAAIRAANAAGVPF